MKKLLGTLAICLLTAGMAAAQTGSVTGLVVDELGAPIEGARVSLHADGICVAHMFSDADGTYLFEDVAVGIYTVKAGLKQVGNASIEGIEVFDGQLTTVDPLVLAGTGGGGSGPHGPKYKHQNQYGGGE